MAERVTAEQAARRLGVTVRTLWRWRDAGRIAEAPRTGNYVMFYERDVNALLYETRGVPRPDELTTSDVYMRLADADSWEDVDAIRNDLAAAICSHAEDKGPLEAAYRAACSMAATHPDEDARGRWAGAARRYGLWLCLTPDETDRAIRYRRQDGSYCTYESARGEMEKAPSDPAYAIAAAAGGR